MSVIGVVENMSLFICPYCSKESRIFHHSEDGADEADVTGGGKLLAQKTGVSFLGGIPLDPAIVRSTERGMYLLDPENIYKPSASTKKSFLNVVENIKNNICKD